MCVRIKGVYGGTGSVWMIQRMYEGYTGCLGEYKGCMGGRFRHGMPRGYIGCMEDALGA